MNRREEKIGGAEPAPVPEFAARHYSPMQIAEMWGVAVATVRDIFQDEPGVLVIGAAAPRPGRRNRYRTLRIPESVLERVHRRLSKAG